jgi:hypothetical protein
MPCTLGRAQLPSPDSVRQEGDTLRIGHGGYPFEGLSGQVMAAQLGGYPNTDEPVVPFTYSTDYAFLGQDLLDGFYFVESTKVDWVKLAAGMFAWEAQLVRVPDMAVPRIELSVGGTLRGNDHGIIGGGTVAILAPNVGAYSIAPGQYNAVSSRTGEDGVQAIYYDTSPGATPDYLTWLTLPGDYYDGCPRLEVYYDTWTAVTARQIPNSPTSWRITNGLVRVTSTLTAAKTELSIEHFDGTVWDPAKVWQLTNDTSYTAIAQAPNSVQVLHNRPDSVSVRVDLSTTSLQTLDVTLRRGVRYLDCRLTGVTTPGIRRGTNEAATLITVSGDAGIRATADSSGNKYVAGTTLDLAGSDLTIGAMRVATGDFPFMIGSAIGGTVGTGLGETEGEWRAWLLGLNHRQRTIT